jgi:hypothetical protein
VELALAEHVHMDVADGLSAQLVAVHHQAKALGAALLAGQLLGGVQQVAGQRLVGFGEVGEGGDVALGDHQKMHRRLRADIVEGDELIVLVELARRNLTGDDLAEQAVHGQAPEPLLEALSLIACAKAGQSAARPQGAAVKNDIHDLGLVLDSKVKLVVIESWDELRVLETLTSLAVKRGLGLHTWSVTEGLQRLGFGGAPLGEEASLEPEAALKLIKADQQPNLYVMCDLHPYLQDNPRLVRLLKEIAMSEAAHKPTLVLVSHALRLPAEVQRHAARFSLALPSEDELLSIVRDEATRWSERNRGARVRTDNRTLQQVVKNLRGLSHAEARALARNVICDDGAITQEDIPELNKTKFQLLDLEGVLSFEYDTARFADVGGLLNLKRWLAERQVGFLEGKGVDAPKGVLLVGVQGGGKSLAAKAVAGLWGLPLLRLDFACLYNKFFGETERNLREALRLAEQMAPCVLWMDEVEKGLASGDHDGGVSQRVLGTLLTWMAERKAPVFVVATANAIDRLPPELVRKGRFDEERPARCRGARGDLPHPPAAPRAGAWRLRPGAAGRGQRGLFRGGDRAGGGQRPVCRSGAAAGGGSGAAAARAARHGAAVGGDGRAARGAARLG